MNQINDEQRRLVRFQPQPEFLHECRLLEQRRSRCRGLGPQRPAGSSLSHVYSIRHGRSALLDEKMASSSDDSISVLDRP